jgi:hypothetical protein
MMKLNTILHTKHTVQPVLLILLFFAMISCTDQQSSIVSSDHLQVESFDMPDAMPAMKFNSTNDQLLKAVKQSTARYNSTTQANRAGYYGDDHCAYDPDLGAMGYHWVNSDLIDPMFDPLQPEVLLYERDKNGNYKLIGVEYIVIDIGQDHPHFGDHPFDIGGTPVPVDHWSLHVWLYKENPNGIFTPYNPAVSCPEM